MLKLVQMEAAEEPPHQPDFRRPAAARRAGPGAGAAAEGAAARRAALGARLQAAEGDADRAEAAAARDRHHLHLRHPRPGRGADHVGPHRGHVAGKILQVGTPAGHLRPARPSASSPTSSARPISSTATSTASVERQGDGHARLRRADLARPCRKASQPNGQVTVVVRPEHAAAVERRPARSVAARSRTSSISAPTPISTCGSTSGEPFIVRQQNTRERGAAASTTATRSASRSATTPPRS